MEAWRNLGQEPVVCHNRMRAVSLNEDDTASFARITSASSENEVQPGSNSPTSSNNNLNTVAENNNKDGGQAAPSLESYITTITSNTSVEAKSHCRHVPHAENRKISWEERMNDYSFMKRWWTTLVISCHPIIKSCILWWMTFFADGWTINAPSHKHKSCVPWTMDLDTNKIGNFSVFPSLQWFILVFICTK